MLRCAIGVCVTAVGALVAPAVRAAPSLPVTNPPIIFSPGWTGPTHDPRAEQGQWFEDVATGSEAARTHEFYDNVPDPAAGGGFAGSTAITGTVNGVTTDPASSNITAFGVLATITNDTPALSPWAMGMNSHLEGLMLLSMEDQYQGPLLETVLAASFAIAPNRLPPDGAPYIDQTPHIVAVNHDAVAWHCWTPDNPEGYVPAGGYFVPSWDFGNIDPGQPASRQMDFVIDDPAGLDPSDPRYDVILGTGDILMNQSTSLKISDWISPLAADMGAPYPTLPNLSSDVSVFHNVPEPATLALLALGGLARLSRRRK